MDLGLGNLAELKAALLAPALAARNDFDAAIALIGRGVAASFDKFCNRRFKRAAGATDTFTADRDHYYLSRYPIESVVSTEQKYSESEGWVAAPGLIQHRDDTSGRLYFGFESGAHDSLIRVTYTGGYWFDDTETATGEQPAGSAILPDDIKFAWAVQCQHAWALRDKLGHSIAASAGAESKLESFDLVPEVRRVLQGYIRYQIT